MTVQFKHIPSYLIDCIILCEVALESIRIQAAFCKSVLLRLEMAKRTCAVNENDFLSCEQAFLKFFCKGVKYVGSYSFHDAFFGDEPASPLEDHTLTHGSSNKMRNMSLPLHGLARIHEARLRAGSMSEEPTVDAFMRHLQVCVEEARTIADAKEREQRLWQLESALQEAIIYKNRVEELQRHGIDPVRLVDSADGITPAPAPKKVEALMTGHVHCSTCRAVLEPDLAFCPACGAEK